MKRNIGELWSTCEGSRKLWHVQFPKGIITFKTKRVALLWSNQLKDEVREGLING